MAITIVDTHATYSNSSTTITIDAPTGLSNGDVLVALLTKYGSTSPALPDGWTSLNATSGTTLSSRLMYKVANSEPSSYTFGTFGSSYGGVVALMALRGASSSPDDFEYSANTFTAPEVTTTVDDCIVLRMCFSSLAVFSNYPRTHTFPEGVDELWDLGTTTAWSSCNQQAGGYAMQETAGASGTCVITPSNTSNLATGRYGAATLAFAPGAAGQPAQMRGAQVAGLRQWQPTGPGRW